VQLLFQCQRLILMMLNQSRRKLQPKWLRNLSQRCSLQLLNNLQSRKRRMSK
jgi:hypothetical protein